MMLGAFLEVQLHRLKHLPAPMPASAITHYQRGQLTRARNVEVIGSRYFQAARREYVTHHKVGCPRCRRGSGRVVAFDSNARRLGKAAPVMGRSRPDIQGDHAS